MNISVKYATSADAALLAEIASKTFYETYEKTHLLSDLEAFVNEHYSLTTTSNDLLKKTTHYLLVFQNKELAGYAKLSSAKSADVPPAAKKPLEIARFYLLKEFQKKGLGKFLMKACLNHADKHKQDAIWLAVWEHNAKAIQFYEHCGFQQYGETTFPLKSMVDRDLLMWKHLGKWQQKSSDTISELFIIIKNTFYLHFLLVSFFV